MSIPLAALEDIIDRSGAAQRIEALPPRGVSIEEIAHLVGHASTRTTEVVSAGNYAR